MSAAPGLRLDTLLAESDRETLRARRQRIVRELEHGRALDERETLELIRELREIRARLKDGAA